MCRIALTAYFFIVSLHAQSPAKLEELRSQYNQAVDKQMLELTTVYMKSLEGLLDAYTKEGNLDAALAVRKEISKMNKEVYVEMQAQQSSLKNSEVLGEWKSKVNTKRSRYSTNFITLQEDGRVTKKNSEDSGRWAIEDRALRITWNRGDVWTFHYHGLRVPKELDGSNSHGKKTLLSKH